ncbi:acyl-CoA-binding domain-containing protein 4 isoform X1 [Calypte anna]|uniref:acyl-CoA-binding domain-containing protein 4 isoform X1 n=1 Tax=Calypte anna TaxID=9244 RepID=UPI0011C41B0E|nr:acyl-CoA-binding domain-containing protein 4 isoform X1 [Calypte anna]
MEEAANCGAQFRAAVQVIQGLPRSGSYRPSYEEMLRFYSYYKQATAGRCQGPRPGFWDPIGRYKWDAWHSLGKMSKEEAMAAYVAEMKKVAQKVIDTVPMDETTEEMFRYFEPLYEVIHDMPRPPETFFKRKGGSREPTADPSQEEPPGTPREHRDGQQVPGDGLAPATEATEGGPVTSDSEGDVFCDTLEQVEPEQAGCPLGLCPPGGQGEGGEGRRAEGRSTPRDPRQCGTGRDGPALPRELPAELETRVAGTVRALQDDMRRVLERLSQLETRTAQQGHRGGTGPGQALPSQAASPWPLPVSPHTLLFLFAWPFITQWLLRRWQGRKR